MPYEFTKQKLVAERRAKRRKLVVAVLAGVVGLAVGMAVNDMRSTFGAFAAVVLAAIAGLAVYHVQ